MPHISVPFVCAFVALMASYFRWLFLMAELWRRLQKENPNLYLSLGSPIAQDIHPGGPVLKFLFSRHARTVGSEEFLSFCKQMRRFLFFHLVFSVVCVIFLLFVGLSQIYNPPAPK